MPRKPRFFVPGFPAHVIQRGNNRQPIFFEENDYRIYLDWVRQAAERNACSVHAYVLMGNHVHFLITPQETGGISQMMQYLGRFYVPYVNHTYGRSGTLWEGRFKASLVQEQHYLFACYRYIELNPVRAGMVEAPGDYPWSSYRTNGLDKPNRLLSPHPDYLALGNTNQSRCAAYRDLFSTHLEAKLLDQLRAALQTGTPFGNDRFREQIENILERKVGYLHPGRPKKGTDKRKKNKSEI